MSTKCPFLESIILSKSITRYMNIKWYFPSLSQLRIRIFVELDL